MPVKTCLSDGRGVPLTGPAAKFSRTPTGMRNPAPSFGQDNEAILAGLGFSSADCVPLRGAGVI